MESLRHRPRVSRETRLLLATVCVATAALWVLARVRSLESGSGAPAGAAPALLAPLVGESHDQLNADIARLETRISPWLTTLAVEPAASRTNLTPPGSVPSVRVRGDLALAIAPPGSTVRPDAGTEVVGSDQPTGLTVIRDSVTTAPPPLSIWPGEPPRSARYLMAAEPTPAGVTLRPFLARGATEKVVKGWRHPLWRLPATAAIAAGTALFTTSAEFVGIVVNDDGGTALAPAQTILEEMDRLLARSNRAAGDLGIEVEELSPEVATLVGVPSGLIVTWVDSSGPAAKALQTGDVIQQLDGQQVSAADDWLLSTARILQDDEVQLSVVRSGMPQDVRVTAATMSRPASAPRQAGADGVGPRAVLGLEMGTETGQGISVRGVDPGSRAEEAGLAVGDLITRAGSVNAPTPAQLRQALAKGPVLVAITRGARHHVLALQP
jgi:S1-C subfamily serine protease